MVLQQIVRLAMCERSPLGLSHAQNRMSGRPQVDEILLMRSVIPPQIPPTNMMCEKFGLFGTVGKFSIKSHSGVSSLDGKRSRDPGVCACAEVPVSGATCVAALHAHCVRAHTADL